MNFQIVGCIFLNNAARVHGAVMSISFSHENVIQSCVFKNNTAQSDSAIYSYSPGKLLLAQSTFYIFDAKPSLFIRTEPDYVIFQFRTFQTSFYKAKNRYTTSENQFLRKAAPEGLVKLDELLSIYFEETVFASGKSFS